MKYYVTIDGTEFTVELDGDAAIVSDGDERRTLSLQSARHIVQLWGPPPDGLARGTLRLLVDGLPVEAGIETEKDRLRKKFARTSRQSGNLRIHSPLPGVIRRVLLFPGNPVKEGESILTLDAMKMENEIRAEFDGVIQELLVAEGQVVQAGQPLAEIVREGED